MSKKIFISHSVSDEKIGEKLVDSLINLGIPQDIIFYSSKYHTGVGLGNDFTKTVKMALSESEVVILLLTKNFYKSEYCLNEMGAAWFSDKKCIPILLGGLQISDMKGFIDSHYIAMWPNESDVKKLSSILIDYCEIINDLQTYENIFKDFIDEANRIATINNQHPEEITEAYSNIEKNNIQNKFTDEEILLLNFFIINHSSIFRNVFCNGKKTSDMLEFEKYFEQFDDFNYEKAEYNLSKSQMIFPVADYNGDYMGYEIPIDVFRDLLSVSERGKKHIESVIIKHTTIQLSDSKKPCNIIEEYIKSNKIKELDALLFAYMIDTNDINLGDRWMATGTIESIKRWEEENSLYNYKLSSNYHVALNSLINRDFLDVKSTTSYGNPREYRLKPNLVRFLNDISEASLKILNKVVEDNKCEKKDIALPF